MTSAARRASRASSSVQQPRAPDRYVCGFRDKARCTPVTSCPASAARAAATAESTPPLIAASTRMGLRVPGRTLGPTRRGVPPRWRPAIVTLRGYGWILGHGSNHFPARSRPSPVEGGGEFSHEPGYVGHVRPGDVEDLPPGRLQGAESRAVVGELLRIDMPLAVVFD